jgi:hypothetical protein
MRLLGLLGEHHLIHLVRLNLLIQYLSDCQEKGRMAEVAILLLLPKEVMQVMAKPVGLHLIKIHKNFSYRIYFI